ncbi:MAG: hypothetical protein LJF30_22200 [Acidobacteria bacterium]|jgi:hypothetical protein|nr:hypothetical protein [Acidobacteriota bacterium]
MKLFFVSVVLVPVLLGILAASDPRPRRGLAWLLASFGLFTVVYAAIVHLFFR